MILELARGCERQPNGTGRASIQMRPPSSSTQTIIILDEPDSTIRTTSDWDPCDMPCTR